MTTTNAVALVPDISNDARIRVFRRYFSAPGEFDNLQVDAYVVITERYVVICDSLLCPEDMAIVIDAVRDELTTRQLLVINSHADWDHTWGNGFFSGAVHQAPQAPIIAHEYCRTRMLSEEAKASLADYQQRYAIFQNVVLTPPTLTFSQRLTIYGGDLTLELLSAPGHCPDHIAIWIPELRTLLAFDAVESPLPLIGDAQQVQPMFATLEHFLAMQPQQVFCSHGEKTGSAVIERNQAYLREIERRCRRFTTHTPISTVLKHASAFINYSLDEAVGGSDEIVDQSYYSWTHNHNVSCIMQWLMA